MTIFGVHRFKCRTGATVIVIHIIKWHITLFGGFRDNYGLWYDECKTKIICKFCGREV